MNYGKLWGVLREPNTHSSVLDTCTSLEVVCEKGLVWVELITTRHPDGFAFAVPVDKLHEFTDQRGIETSILATPVRVSWTTGRDPVSNVLVKFRRIDKVLVGDKEMEQQPFSVFVPCQMWQFTVDHMAQWCSVCAAKRAAADGDGDEEDDDAAE